MVGSIIKQILGTQERLSGTLLQVLPWTHCDANQLILKCDGRQVQPNTFKSLVLLLINSNSVFCSFVLNNIDCYM